MRKGETKVNRSIIDNISHTGSWRNRAAALLVSGALVGTMAGSMGAAAAPERAWAADGSVTITQVANPDATYDAYRLFTADIDDQNMASNVAWDASVDTGKQTALVTQLGQDYIDWLKANKGVDDAGVDTAKVIAQNALEYISAQIVASVGTGVHDPKWPSGESFANGFAKWVHDNIQPAGTATQGVEFTGPEGYYLFLTTATTLDPDDTTDMATLPIWFPLGGAATTVDEKAAAPSIDKEVQEDSNNAWGDYADYEIGQEIPYRITVTIPDNYGGFTSFKALVTDNLSAGLSVSADDVQVFVGDADTGTEVTDKFDINVAGQTLTVGNDNTLDGTTGVSEITPGCTLTITYTATLTGADIVYGDDGNPNTATFEFSNDPHATTTGTTTEVGAKVYTFAVNVDKMDKVTNQVLSGAEFVIKNAEGKFLKDGAWTADTQDDAQKFVTNAQGVITDIKGLDAGTYTLIETKAPDSYELPANPEITLVVTPAYDGDGNLTGLTGTVTGAFATGDTGNTSADTGTVGVDVTNDKNVTLALTGAAGVGLGGAAVVAVGLGWYLVRTRRNRAEQQDA